MTTGRVLIGLAVAVCLLALGGLEMLTERAGVDRAIWMTQRPGVVERDPVWDTIAPPEGPDPALDGAQLTMALQAGRMTVVDVDPKAGRLVAVNGTGRVLEPEVGGRTVVVAEGKPIGQIALLQAGDVIRLEPTAGQVQRIVLLRHARQLESPDQ
ncbi:MAG TPA: hypothetical protein VFT36_03250 [Methylomirabilota bacterium]|nr:hypothetical protein [Methylomirabilota bacterium]